MKFTSPLLLLASCFLARQSLARECVQADDSIMPFRFFWANPYRSCIWVSEDKASRCSMTHDAEGSVYKHCPFTCKDHLPEDIDSIDCDANESDLHFPVLIPKGDDIVYKFKKCIWLTKGTAPGQCQARCARTGISETCPLTCASCPFESLA